MSDADNSDEEYDFVADSHHHLGLDKKYPLHDCCEFEDVEALKELIYLPLDDDDSVDSSSPKLKPIASTNEDSSSDENDSTAAAHAAAIGHSPQPLKGALDTGGRVFAESPSALETGSKQQPENAEGEKDVAAVAISGGAINKATDSESAVQNPDALNKEKDKEDKDDKEEENEKAIVESLEKKEEHAADKVDEVKTGDIPALAETSKEPAVDIEKGKEGEDKKKEDAMDIDDAKPNPTGKRSESTEKVHDDSGTGAEASNAVNEKNPSPKIKRQQVSPHVHLNERDEDENTALHVAIHARKLEHVKVLLEAGASFRMKCDGSLPIHTAISMGSVGAHRQFAYECVVLLHEHGADLSMKDESVHTPLFLSCMFNLPQVVTYILSDSDGLGTLNTRADRAGNRPLHAAAKYDTLDNPSFSRSAAASATGHVRAVHHHPDGTLAKIHPIPGFPGKLENMAQRVATSPVGAAAAIPSTEALLTQVLLGTQGIEVDAVNVMGQTPLHVACMRGNWPVARLLLQAGADPNVSDRRGYTPGQLAYKRGQLIPNDLVDVLGDPAETGVVPPLRDLIVDPNGPTICITHELCILHRTCAPIHRDSPEPPPENVRRLHVLIDKETGILRSGEFGSMVWKNEARRAAMADILKVHEYAYIERVSELTSSIPDHPNAIAHLDADTAISRWSFEAALRAAGAMCQAVDRVVAGECRNAFCAVRPPGHHAGPRGIVKCANDLEGGSHGFCLLNNVAIGAAYARSMYRNEGIRKVAIIDFDVHHGNGTEAIIRNLVPTVEKGSIRTPFAFGDISTTSYRPWLDETDIQNVFFASTHGYGNRGYDQPGWFYPASGKTHTTDAIAHPSMVENPSLADFLLSQTWSRMGEDSRMNSCKIINVGFDLPEPDADPQARSMKQRLELRDTYRKNILPNLRDFDPDLIFISAGFDGHRKDTMNFGYVGMVEDDYEWITEQLVKIANTCCNGRIISVLEGGYKVHGGIVSPFARSVASHVRALVDGGRSRELYDPQDGEWEGQFERHLFERRERKKEQEREQLRLIEEANHRRNMLEQWSTHGGVPDDPDAPSRKRKRNQVNYKELFKQMQEEGFAG